MANKKPLAIILEPVRDLAEQTQDVLISFKKYLINPEIESALGLHRRWLTIKNKESGSPKAAISSQARRVKSSISSKISSSTFRTSNSSFLMKLIAWLAWEISQQF